MQSIYKAFTDFCLCGKRVYGFPCTAQTEVGLQEGKTPY